MGTRRKIYFGGNIGINDFCWVEKRNPTYVLKLPAQVEKYRIVQDRMLVADFDKMVKTLETNKSKTEKKG